MHHQNAPQQFSTALTTQLNPRLLYLFSQHAVEEEMLTPELVQAFTDLSDENTQLVEILDILEGELAESLKFGNILLRWWSEIPIPVNAIGTSILGYKFYTNYVGNNKKSMFLKVILFQSQIFQSFFRVNPSRILKQLF